MLALFKFIWDVRQGVRRRGARWRDVGGMFFRARIAAVSARWRGGAREGGVLSRSRGA